MSARRRVWCNLGGGVRMSGVVDMLERVLAEEPDLGAILTSSKGGPAPERLPERIEYRADGVDVPALLREAAPSVAIFTGDDLMLGAVQTAKEAGIPTILVDARVPRSSGLTRFWLDMRMRGRLRFYDRILTATEVDAAQFRNVVSGQIPVDVIGPLERGPRPLPCDEREYDTIAELVAPRPVWCATGLVPEEFAVVEAAHRRASRTSHRLMMIAVPADPSDGIPLADQFISANWQVARREAGDYPEPDTQIYVADTADELGLWYRLAPIAFLGSSLSPDGRGQSPFSPAFLGSAVIHGPHMPDFVDEVQQLQAGRASTVVKTGDELGQRVIEFLSPDRAAQQAHRAWEVTSASAETATRAMEAILDALDRSPA